MAALLDFDDATPAAPTGRQNVKWQATSPGGACTRDISAHIPNIAGVNAQAGTSYTIQASDNGKLVTFNNSSAVAVTVPHATTLDAKFSFAVQNLGAGTVTLTPTTSAIDGGLSLALAQNQGVLIYSDASNYFTERGMSPTDTDTSIIGCTFFVTGTDAIQIPFGCTITGWAIMADVSGSASVDICFHAGSAPPSAPSIPNTTTDKISASAPVALSSAQSAAGGASAISTWTTALSQWGSVLFNLTSLT